MRCKMHNKGFTLYPPGFVPHARKKIAPVGPDGALLSESSDSKPFESTYFDAALDGCAGRPWPAQSIFGSLDSRFRTQQRHMDRAALILGIGSEINEKQREQIAHVLSIPGQVMYDSALLFENHRNYHIKGKAICNLLDEIDMTASVFERLAMAGFFAGIWPKPWIVKSTCLTSMFRNVRTRGSPG
jgi:hypothetical protein